MSDVAQVLRDALNKLAGGKNWVKQEFKTEDGKVCALGACGFIDERQFGYDEEYLVTELGVSFAAAWRIEEVARTEFPDRSSWRGLGHVLGFNDHDDTTWADVERVFEKAIANAEAEL